jgi:hypothetical protein
MSKLDSLKLILNDYRNSIKSDLSDEHLSEIDSFISKVANDMAPIFSMIEKIGNSEELLSNLKKELDNHMRENKWHEKHSKTS